MTNALSSILVVGAAGHLGQDVCHAFISQRRLFTRLAFFNDTSRPASAAKISLFDSFIAVGMEQISGIYTDLTPFKGFDCVLMLLGNKALKYQPTLVDSAIEAGVRHFYPSEFGADLTVGDNWSQRYDRDKDLTRQHLERRGKDVLDLGWTHSVIKHFGVDNKTHTAEIYGSPEGRQSLLSVADTLTFLIRTLKISIDPTNPHRRTYRFQGSSPSWSKIFFVLEKITGKNYEVVYHPVEEGLEKEKKATVIGDVGLELEASH